MKRRRLLLLAVGLLALVGLAIYLLGAPRPVSAIPSAGAQDVPAGQPLRLEFSAPMLPGDVESRLRIEPPVQGEYRWEGKTLVFTPAKSWPAGSEVTIHLDAGARRAGLLPLSMRQDTSWGFKTRRPRLLYLYPSDGPANIYMLVSAAEEPQQLTNFPAGVMEYHVSAAGDALFFSARRGQEGSAVYRLEIAFATSQENEADVEAISPEPRLVLECSRAVCHDPQISPQGNYLAFERTAFPGQDEPAYPQVWLVPLAYEEQDHFPRLSGEPRLAGEAGHQTLQPAWSPAGWLTFYDTNLAAFVALKPETGESIRFPNQTGQPGSWDPAGLVYVAPEITFVDANEIDTGLNLDTIANSYLIRYHRLDGRLERLTQEDDVEDSIPVFSPDGFQLAFARKFLSIPKWTPGRQLWLMRSNGSDAYPLTDDPNYNHYDFVWSPGGDELAFVRFDQTVLTQPPELWLATVSTDQMTELVIGGYAPQWIP